jgi:hypothetical protein
MSTAQLTPEQQIPQRYAWLRKTSRKKSLGRKIVADDKEDNRCEAIWGQVLQYNTQVDLSFRAACVARPKTRLTVA